LGEVFGCSLPGGGGGFCSDGAAGCEGCWLEQPAAIISAAIESKTKLRFIESTSLIDSREG
jgi:hypothetical protein